MRKTKIKPWWYLTPYAAHFYKAATEVLPFIFVFYCADAAQSAYRNLLDAFEKFSLNPLSGRILDALEGMQGRCQEKKVSVRL